MTPTTSRLRDTTGSMPMAMIGTIMVAGIVVAFLSLVVMSQRTTRMDRDFQHAIHGADAAVNDAVTDINAYDADGGIDYSNSTMNSLTGSGTFEDVSYEYEAQKVGWTTWEVTVMGQRGDRTRHLEAEVVREVSFPLGAFADVRVDLTGNNTIASYNTATGDTDTGNGTVGTNGKITMASSSSADLIHLYGSAAKCTGPGCSSGTQIGTDDPMTWDLERVEQGLQDCAAAGETLEVWRASDHGGVIDNNPSGQLCVSDLIFDRDTLVGSTAPVKVYVTGDVEIAKKADVNCTGCDDLNGALPDAVDLQIYSKGPAVRTGNHANVAAVLYAPAANCTGNPSNSQAVFYGSMVCKDMKNQGGWSYYFDDALLSYSASAYDVETLREEVGGTTSFD